MFLKSKNYRVVLSVLLLAITIYFSGCNFQSSDSESSVTFDSTAIKDSLLITEALRNTYQWYETQSKLYDFTLKYKNSVCVGVDQEAELKRVEELEKTNLFDPVFIETYNKISSKIDTQIKTDTVKYYEGDGLELDWISADPWCNCQDSPDKYWESLKIKSLVVEGDMATVIWTWNMPGEFQYEVKLKKTGSVWKVMSLQGFEKILHPDPVEI